MAGQPSPFWMVYGVGQRAPTVRHKSFESADTEAKRLAKSLPDIEFFVLQTVSMSVHRTVVTVPIDVTPRFPLLTAACAAFEDPDIPF
ncbi:hypothetical protein KHC28_00235 [Ancylobacter sonchi]|uniref:hypothetical protein n=1 Tax=Ancylobacter sonchi TaxID=1937790 RepID=UPI001BD6160C|nr:hypothetical protein [Ancylobacter sonchi]MBS7532092.1 hypothetical protein [Ancylobacter sonchi]